MTGTRIFLIDDNIDRINSFKAVLSFLEYQVTAVSGTGYESVLDDLENVSAMFIGHGLEKQATLVKSILEKAEDIPVLLLIQPGGILQIPTAIQKMVVRCVEWPTHYESFKEVLDQFPKPKSSSAQKNRENTRHKGNKGLAGHSQAIFQIHNLIEQVAASNATVLVLGESGTGKEVVAKAIHRCSERHEKPFVPVNCGAIPSELLESELFGHEKGAFTGALTARQGRFEMAEGGTLFLDEIGDMPMPMQVKLLRVLQERTFERVGSNKTIQCDVRVIAATHRNLEKEIQENRFREDLFYRLNVFPIELPPLKNRAEDIPVLVKALVERFCAQGQSEVSFTEAALAMMMQHSWPGNVRELANFIERLTITHPNVTVDVEDLPEKFQSYSIPQGFVLPTNDNPPETEVKKNTNSTEAVATTDVTLDSQTQNPSSESSLSVSKEAVLPEQGIDLKEYLNTLEINLIQQALNESGGIVAHAAKRLNMRRTTLVEKLRKYEIS